MLFSFLHFHYARAAQMRVYSGNLLVEVCVSVSGKRYKLHARASIQTAIILRLDSCWLLLLFLWQVIFNDWGSHHLVLGLVGGLVMSLNGARVLVVFLFYFFENGGWLLEFFFDFDRALEPRVRVALGPAAIALAFFVTLINGNGHIGCVSALLALLFLFLLLAPTHD